MPAKSFAITCITLILLMGFQSDVFSQQASDEETEEFINLGPISFSKNYELPPERNYIIFKIRNNTSQTISNIFGWVYYYLENKSKSEVFHLVNNPHRGGIIIEGKPHLSQDFARWRFPISPPTSPPKPEDRYTLRIHSKGIFFSNHSGRVPGDSREPNK